MRLAVRFEERGFHGNGRFGRAGGREYRRERIERADSREVSIGFVRTEYHGSCANRSRRRISDEVCVLRRLCRIARRKNNHARRNKKHGQNGEAFSTETL